MQNAKQLFVATLNDELPRFIRVLEALPEDKLNWKPDPKSRTALELANMIATEAATFKSLFETGTVSFNTSDPLPAYGAPTEISTAFRNSLEEAISVADKLTDEDWDGEAVMLVNGHEDWKTTKGIMAWGFLLDLIHHRGQLATYIRPMGGQVPSIYGPSADSKV